MANDLTGKTLGRYQIMERLGRGGMADVYRAYQPSMDRYVAVKVMHGHLTEDESFITRFKREAQSVGTLRHPNIVQVIDFDIEGDQYFMVMEYIKGDTLKAMLSGSGALSVDDAVDIAIKLADALAYAHSRGLIHRDIKPANILMTSPSSPVVTDFGIARIMDATGLTSSGISIGTPAYMSPEAGRGEKVDERGDVYSLGIVLYEMLTGTVPYDADTPYAVILKHINDPLPMPRQLSSSIPEAVERIVLKALAKNPSDRYQSAQDMKTALENAQASLVTALPTRSFPFGSDAPTVKSNGAQTRLPAWAVALGVIALVVIVGGLLLSTANRPPAPSANIQVPTNIPTQPPAQSTSSPAPTIAVTTAPSEVAALPSQPLPATTSIAATVDNAATTASTAQASIATQPANVGSQVDPKYATLVQSGRQAMIDGNAADLLPKIEQALKGDPQSYDLLVIHGALELSAGSSGDISKALADAQSAMKLNADRSEAYIVLGGYYFSANSDTSDQRIASLKQAIGYFSKAIQKGSQDYYVYWFNAKANAELNGDVGPENNVPWAKVDEDFEHAARFAPADFRFFMERGQNYANQKQYDRAQQSFEQALTIRPYDGEAEGALAQMFLLSKEAEKAFALYSEAISKANIHDPRYIADAAFIARASGHVDNADEWGKLALALDPNTPAASYVLGLLALDKGAYQSAITYLDQAAKADDSAYSFPFLNRTFDRSLQADRARVLIALNRLDEADTAYTAALAQNNDWMVLYVERAKLSIQRNDLGKARDDLRIALQLANDSNDTTAQKEIVDLLKKVGPGSPAEESPTPTP